MGDKLPWEYKGDEPKSIANIGEHWFVQLKFAEIT